jgi:hypothetical protein
MKKVLFICAVIVLTVQLTKIDNGVFAGQQRAGEVIPIGDTLFIKVNKATTPFAGVKLNGEAFVAVLEMESGKKGATLFYKISANPDTSEIFLMSGTKKIAPRAVIEDFPSWGSGATIRTLTLSIRKIPLAVRRSRSSRRDRFLYCSMYL